MGKGYLIDSNAISDFFNGSLPEAGKQLLNEAKPIISIVTYIEIFSSSKISPIERKKLQDFIKIAKIYPVDVSIANETIQLRLLHRIKLPDAIIAATAKQYQLTLITRNVNDFDISGLDIINPHSI